LTPASSRRPNPSLAAATESIACKICGAATLELGTKFGTSRRQLFHLRRCDVCRYTFVSDPWTDFAAIYSDAYYHGQGPDPLSDYYSEISDFERTHRFYEWRGVFSAVASLVPLNHSTQWLDFGCGSGGLVRYACSQSVSAVGFEEGSIASLARSAGVPLVGSADLADRAGSFDVVTAIEVLEHVVEPMETLRQIRRLLRPGGLFFYTTGNAKPYRDRLLEWSYCVPEIHVGFFEPETMRVALLNAGFRPEFPGYLPGFTDMIHYRTLKNVGLKQRSFWERLLPWPLVSRAVQLRFQALTHPIGWADGACA
jgi:SAM-dependent methyltransferase